MKSEDLEKISLDLFNVTHHLVEAGHILKDIPFDECQIIQQNLYHTSKALLDIIGDLEPRLSEQRKINSLYSEEISEMGDLLDG